MGGKLTRSLRPAERVRGGLQVIGGQGVGVASADILQAQLDVPLGGLAQPEQARRAEPQLLREP